MVLIDMTNLQWAEPKSNYFLYFSSYYIKCIKVLNFKPPCLPGCSPKDFTANKFTHLNKTLIITTNAMQHRWKAFSTMLHGIRYQYVIVPFLV